MRSVDQWLEDYGASHRHPVNKALHWLCVPPIVMTVLGLLWSIPVPTAFAALSPWLNWATLAGAAAIAWYFLLSAALAAGLVPVLLAMCAVVAWLDTLAWPLWQSCLAIFVVAWIGQFVGHAVEGQRPSFFKDLQFLLVGPLWLLAFVYRSLGLRYSAAPPLRPR
jgi:uncharacterized membrane protein YGL010W